MGDKLVEGGDALESCREVLKLCGKIRRTHLRDGRCVQNVEFLQEQLAELSSIPNSRCESQSFLEMMLPTYPKVKKDVFLFWCVSISCLFKVLVP